MRSSAGVPSAPRSGDRVALLRWTAGLGAITAEALAQRTDSTVASARARLAVAERDLLLVRHRPLADRPALYTITRRGLRVCQARGLDPCRVSAAGAAHLIECARVAAALECRYSDHSVMGERELRREEREQGCALASAELAGAGRAELTRHRPDLVLWPCDASAGLPTAVEVELTIKSAERLTEICRAWARARCVAGVLYLVAPGVERALRRAIDRAYAHERVLAVPLTVLSFERAVPSAS